MRERPVEKITALALAGLVMFTALSFALPVAAQSGNAGPGNNATMVELDGVPNGTLHYEADDMNNTTAELLNDGNESFEFNVTRNDSSNNTTFYLNTSNLTVTENHSKENLTLMLDGEEHNMSWDGDWAVFNVTNWSTHTVALNATENTTDNGTNNTTTPAGGPTATILDLPTFGIGQVAGIPYWAFGLIALVLGGGAFIYFRSQNMTTEYIE